MKTPIDRIPTITYHFDGSTLTSEYEDDEQRDAAFERVSRMLQDNATHLQWNDAIINIGKCLYITKEEKWSYPRGEQTNTLKN